MDHHHAHEQWVDPVSRREAERDRRDDRDGGRAERAEGRQQAGDPEHHPRDEGHPPAYQSHGAAHHQVDGAVVLGDREQVRDTDQGQEQVARETGDDVVGLHPDGEGADQEGGDEPKRAHVDGQQRGRNEHRDEGQDRNQFERHRDLRILMVD